jgi:hypothetical protein
MLIDAIRKKNSPASSEHRKALQLAPHWRAHKNTKHHKTENNEIHKDKNTYLAYTKEVRDLLQRIANWDNGLQKSVS